MGCLVSKPETQCISVETIEESLVPDHVITDTPEVHGTLVEVHADLVPDQVITSVTEVPGVPCSLSLSNGSKYRVVRSMTKFKIPINSYNGIRSTNYSPRVAEYSNEFFILPKHWVGTNKDTWPENMRLFTSRIFDEKFKGIDILRSIDRYYYNDRDFLALKDFVSSEIKKGKTDFVIRNERYKRGVLSTES